MKYKSKPVVIEACRYTWENSLVEMEKMWGDKFRRATVYNKEGFRIYTLEGVMTVNVGDWVIKGTLGEFYPCKDEVFQNKYEYQPED